MHCLRLLAAAASLALVAAESEVVGPFKIHITGKTNSSIDGYAQACHASAAAEGLCYEPPANAIPPTSYEFYFNRSLDEHGDAVSTGAISWILQVQNDANETLSLPSFLELALSPWSNVAVARIPPPTTDAGFPLSYFADNHTFYFATTMDDATWTEDDQYLDPPSILTNFYLCWQWVDFNWYQSISWVTSLPPHNPTCQPVQLSWEMIEE
ncbi:hypothetical protein F4780DRAFT_780204 [Xylariomycetidae sp. FL0641]|nr:hypothetical protein F4780DRAFT_780204 [Xylariomycetidae sp. FL0641]